MNGVQQRASGLRVSRYVNEMQPDDNRRERKQGQTMGGSKPAHGVESVVADAACRASDRVLEIQIM